MSRASDRKDQRLAALPMYDFPELREAHDALWTALAAALIECGVEDVPLSLTRDLNHRDVWSHPSLLFGQACEYPISQFSRGAPSLVATPRYSAPGCEDASYRSAIVVRAGNPVESLAELRDRRCAVNELDSNSGMNLLRAAVAPLAGGDRFFGSVRLSGSHARSVEIVAADEADVAAIDCVTFAHLQRLRPALAAKVRVLCWSPCSPSLPFVTSARTSAETLEKLRRSLAAVFADRSLTPARERLFLNGVDLQPDLSLSRVSKLRHEATALRYSMLR